MPMIASAQERQDTLQKPSLKPLIVPAVLLASGAISNGSALEKNLNDRILDQLGSDFNFAIDDYLQYAPIGIMYAADIAGVKSKNHWFDQTKYLIMSNVVTAVTTHSMKRLINKRRPNGAPHSFPSGHTSFAFVNAAVLHHEYHNHHELLAWSGYTCATTTGMYRLLNNKHWLSDVLFGAGLGILVTEVIYRIEPLKEWNPFINKSDLSLRPIMSEDFNGISLTFSLN